MLINEQIINGIAILKINRENFLNAINPSLIKKLYDSLKKFIKKEDIGLIILTGEGEKAFIAGADIKEMQKFNDEQAFQFAKAGQKLTNEIENSPKPVIAAINGFALGGGCEIALACHLRYASENARFAQPEVKIGLIPGWGGTQRLPRIIGKGLATEMILSGHMIDAYDALKIGLVNKVFPPDLLIEKTMEISKQILKNSPTALTKSIQCINKSSVKSLSTGLQAEVKSFRGLFDSNETKEGLAAFVEKRQPSFRK